MAVLNLKETTPSHSIRADLETFWWKKCNITGDLAQFSILQSIKHRDCHVSEIISNPWFLAPTFYSFACKKQNKKKKYYKYYPQNIQIRFKYCVRHNKDTLLSRYLVLCQLLALDKANCGILSLIHIKISLIDKRRARECQNHNKNWTGTLRKI